MSFTPGFVPLPVNEEQAALISRIDHTLLSPTAVWEDYQTLCEEALAYHTASVCIPPSRISRVHETWPELTICTVVGFPNGYTTRDIKVSEAKDAMQRGATEIDTVINRNDVKDGNYRAILAELKELRKTTTGAILKVIVETCDLTEDEKIRLCELVTEAGCDYIKTSTGFGSHGAKVEDIELFAKHIGPNVKIKAAGGIHTVDEARSLLQAGADRLGSSSLLGAILAM